MYKKSDFFTAAPGKTQTKLLVSSARLFLLLALKPQTLYCAYIWPGKNSIINLPEQRVLLTKSLKKVALPE